MSFVLCSACARHVRDSDATCPFCGATEFRAAPVARLRKSRGSLLAVGVVATLAGCSDTDDETRNAAVVEATADAGTVCDVVVDAGPTIDTDADVSVPIYDAVPPIPSADE